MMFTIPIVVFGPNDLGYLAVFLVMGMIGTIITGIGASRGMLRWHTPLRILAVTLAVPGLFIFLGWFFSALLG